jgi:DNA polymerase-3 subunit epsilon/exodeoxyribonuclease X
MLTFLDLETTGLEATDKICSIALIDEESYIYELVNEGKKIPAEASSIHHITNEMIQNAPKLEQTQAMKYLQEHNKQENILVGHNITFDLSMLAASGFVWQGGIIDTLKVTKHLIPECELFSLQLLRYELKLYKSEDKLRQKYGIKDALNAHNALGDALVVKLLYEYLQEMADESLMQELSFKHVLLSKFNFGKYRSRYIEEIAMSDRAYLEWMLGIDDLDEDLRYSLEYYLQG